jgi:hypothetical protein
LRWWALLVALAVLTASCGVETATPTPSVTTPTPSVPLEAVEALRERIDGYVEVFIAQNWLEVYRYTEPSFQETCASGDFALAAGISMERLAQLLGLPKDAELRLRGKVTEIQMISPKRARVRGDFRLYADGEPVEFGQVDDSGREWVLIRGEWYVRMDEDCRVPSAS